MIVALVLVALPGQHKKYLTASFPRTVSLYEGSDVRILGVPVGKVETVEPVGHRRDRARCGTTRSTTCPPTPRP